MHCSEVAWCGGGVRVRVALVGVWGSVLSKDIYDLDALRWSVCILYISLNQINFTPTGDCAFIAKVSCEGRLDVTE